MHQQSHHVIVKLKFKILIIISFPCFHFYVAVGKRNKFQITNIWTCRDCVVSVVTTQWDGPQRVNILARLRKVSYLKIVQTDFGVRSPCCSAETRLLSRRPSGRVLMHSSTTQLHLVPRLRMSASVPPFPLRVLKACYRINCTFYLIFKYTIFEKG